MNGSVENISKNYLPLIGNETDEELWKYYRNLQKQYNEYVEDWKWHNFGGDGPDPCRKNAWTVDDKQNHYLVSEMIEIHVC